MTGRYAALFDDVALGAAWLAADQARNALLDADMTALLGLSATSTTSLSIGTGSKTFALTPSTREFQVDSLIRARRAADATAYMVGLATAASAGSVTINALATGGSGGPYTDWIVTVDLTATPSRMISRAVTASGTVGVGDLGGLVYCTGTDTLAFSPVATLAADFWCAIVNISGIRTLDPDGSELIDGLASIVLVPGDAVIVAVVNGALRVVAAKGYGAPLRPHPTVQTGSFNAAVGFVYNVNTSGGASTPTLPADSALAGDEMIAFDDVAATFGTNNCTLTAGSGSTIMGAATFPLNVSYVGARLRYRKSTTDWRIVI